MIIYQTSIEDACNNKDFESVIKYLHILLKIHIDLIQIINK